MSLSGRFARLAYVAGLKNASGGYEHWGLQKIHGEDAARGAIHEAHVRLVAELLATPMKELRAEGLKSDDHEGKESYRRPPKQLLTADAGRATELHLRSVLASLNALSETGVHVSRRAA